MKDQEALNITNPLWNKVEGYINVDLTHLFQETDTQIRRVLAELLLQAEPNDYTDLYNILTQGENLRYRNRVRAILEDITKDSPYYYDYQRLMNQTGINYVESANNEIEAYGIMLFILLDKNLGNLLGGVAEETYLGYTYLNQTELRNYSFVKRPEQDALEFFVHRPSSGVDYSQTLFKNRNISNVDIRRVINQGLQANKPFNEIVDDVMAKLNISYSQAKNVVRVESAYVVNEASLQSYQELARDYDEDLQYQIIATLDTRTTEVCRDADHKIYNVSDAVLGDNFPPLINKQFHQCRTTTRLVVDGPDSPRRARDPRTGETYTIDGKMSYNDWYNSYVAE